MHTLYIVQYTCVYHTHVTVPVYPLSYLKYMYILYLCIGICLYVFDWILHCIIISYTYVHCISYTCICIGI